MLVFLFNLEQIRLQEAIQHRKNGQLHRQVWGEITYPNLLIKELQWHEYELRDNFPFGLLIDESRIALQIACSENCLHGETYGWN